MKGIPSIFCQYLETTTPHWVDVERLEIKESTGTLTHTMSHGKLQDTGSLLNSVDEIPLDDFIEWVENNRGHFLRLLGHVGCGQSQSPSSNSHDCQSSQFSSSVGNST